MLALLFADGNDVTWMVTLIVLLTGEYLQAIYWPPALARLFEILVIDGITLLGGVGITITTSRYIFAVLPEVPAPMNTVGMVLAVLN